MMQANYWLEKWQKDNIGFHKRETNPALLKHFGALSLEKGRRVFVPLCGKTRDIAWLLAKGYRVVGAELVEMAVEQLFVDLGVEPERSDIGDLKHYSAENLEVWGGDIFKLSKEVLGPVDATYDRAALVALPERIRSRYAAHLMDITKRAPQLLVTYAYDQTLMEGPPFSVSREEVRRHYSSYHVSLLESTTLASLKGRCEANEDVWLLRPPHSSSRAETST